ncbi:hypothetical protein HW555_010257 [Spodoptera exigua]|uniref:Uncharacterized protein n=1 Tax=Spodoptera exigua TaxID=7107 RepID=A0A835KZZ7_SPOEX|nr:hypothetical protein HW555_010257 [Spodoptera exigua]
MISESWMYDQDILVNQGSKKLRKDGQTLYETRYLFKMGPSILSDDLFYERNRSAFSGLLVLVKVDLDELGAVQLDPDALANNLCRNTRSSKMASYTDIWASSVCWLRGSCGWVWAESCGLRMNTTCLPLNFFSNSRTSLIWIFWNAFSLGMGTSLSCAFRSELVSNSTRACEIDVSKTSGSAALALMILVLICNLFIADFDMTFFSSAFAVRTSQFARHNKIGLDVIENGHNPEFVTIPAHMQQWT